MSRSLTRNPLCALCLAAFCFGLFFPGAGALWARAQGGLPEAVARKQIGDRAELDPWNSYYRALCQLEDRYYGDLPGEMQLTYAAVRGMLHTLDDPFTRFMDPREYRSQKDETSGDFVGIGIYLDGRTSKQGFLTVMRTVPNGPAAKAGLRAGDRLYQVNTRPVKGLSVEQVSRLIRGASGTAVRLLVRRPKQLHPLLLRVVRQRVEFPVVEEEMKDGKFGYVRLSLFNAHADAQMAHSIRLLEKQGMKGLILDLRGNPGGMLESAIDIVSRFVPPGNCAVIIVQAGGQRQEAGCNPAKYLRVRVPLVVLVDGQSASAAEILAGAIKDTHSGTLVGETTFGKGLVQSVVELPTKAAVAITSAKYLTSSGNDINRTRERRGGVEPDMHVELTQRDVFVGKDTQLDRALQLLREKIAASSRP
jgi:carboxyl-terminal processing protease